MNEGYPTDAELERVTLWRHDDPVGWLAYVKSLWWAPEWGWTQDGATYRVSTGGWSGNEDLIRAMQNNAMLWLLTWRTAHRGGHYTFMTDYNAEAPA